MKGARSTGKRLGAPLGLLSAAAVLLLRPASVLAQCAMCRDAAAASSLETREALNYAILGLAFAPYVVGALAAWMLSPAVRDRARAWTRRMIHRGAGNQT